MRKDAIGLNVKELQRLLIDAGFKVEADGWFGPATEAAVIAFQRRAGLVADGIAGPKTVAALANREKDSRLLSGQNLSMAADRLGVPIAAMMAVNEVESAGAGFLLDGRPKILYERHVAYRLLGETGMDIAEADALAVRYPNLINPARGGYAGGPAEWSRLTQAKRITPPAIAYAACSWGQYQIMGYHWQRLGYASIDAFVAAMKSGEAAHLDAFVRYIEADPALLKAIKAKKWADVARLYNGPAYKENLYDIKLARAYDRYAALAEATA